MPRSARHTMGGREVLDAKTMLDLLEGSASDGGPTVTIDVDVFKDNFGAPPPRRSRLSAGRRSRSSGASRRREPADPAQLKELLQACLLEGNDAAAAASPTSQPPRPAPRRSPRFAKPRRRMTCDQRLLHRRALRVRRRRRGVAGPSARAALALAALFAAGGGSLQASLIIIIRIIRRRRRMIIIIITY